MEKGGPPKWERGGWRRKEELGCNVLHIKWIQTKVVEGRLLLYHVSPSHYC